MFPAIFPGVLPDLRVYHQAHVPSVMLFALGLVLALLARLFIHGLTPVHPLGLMVYVLRSLLLPPEPGTPEPETNVLHVPSYPLFDIRELFSSDLVSEGWS
ncbi:hypothetical protein MRX96_010904 [Rhipicephalus microplus]